MRWELSDGTGVNLGGRVRGDTPLAQALRRDALAVKAGHRVGVQWGVPPGGVLSLDLDDEQLVDVWLRATARRFDVAVTSAPDLGAFTRDNRDSASSDDEPGIIY